MNDFYEYEDKSPKTRELILTVSFLAAGLCLLFISQIPSIGFPSLYQLGMMVCLVTSIMLFTRYFTRRYVYTVLPREGEEAEASLDFTVTEYYGRRVEVVCRISLADIAAATRVNKQNQAQISERQRKKRVYHYTSHLSSPRLCVLEVQDGEDCFFIRIQADDVLLEKLKFYKK